MAEIMLMTFSNVFEEHSHFIFMTENFYQIPNTMKVFSSSNWNLIEIMLVGQVTDVITIHLKSLANTGLK